MKWCSIKSNLSNDTSAKKIVYFSLVGHGYKVEMHIFWMKVCPHKNYMIVYMELS